MPQETLLQELEDIKRREGIIIQELNQEINKDKIEEQKRKTQVKHFTFADFCQSVIGVAVFGLPAFINTSFWDYIPKLDLGSLILAHIFFLSCFTIALNYEFRKDFSWDTLFIINLLKRVFFTYISVMIAVCVILILAKKILLNMQNFFILKNFLIGQSVGLVGAITFSFLRK